MCQKIKGGYNLKNVFLIYNHSFPFFVEEEIYDDFVKLCKMEDMSVQNMINTLLVDFLLNRGYDYEEIVCQFR